jgi:NADPH-dependent curcumin reductase CurA
VLSSRPRGPVTRENFEWREEPVPSIAEGEFLIRNLWLSCDPAQRPWMEVDTYIPRMPLAPAAHNRLFTGQNLGKQLVKIADASFD